MTAVQQALLGAGAVRVEPGRLDEVCGRRGPGVRLRLLRAKVGQVGGQRGVGPGRGRDPVPQHRRRRRPRPRPAARPRRAARRGGPARARRARRRGPAGAGRTPATGCRRRPAQQARSVASSSGASGSATPAERARPRQRGRACRARRRRRRARGSPAQRRGSDRRTSSGTSAATAAAAPRSPTTARELLQQRPGVQRAAAGCRRAGVRAARTVGTAPSTPSCAARSRSSSSPSPREPQHRAAVPGDEPAQAVRAARDGVVAGHHQGEQLVGDQPAQREDQGRSDGRSAQCASSITRISGPSRPSTSNSAQDPGADGDRVVERHAVGRREVVGDGQRGARRPGDPGELLDHAVGAAASRSRRR